jgi:hypothetical protein
VRQANETKDGRFPRLAPDTIGRLVAAGVNLIATVLRLLLH